MIPGGSYVPANGRHPPFSGAIWVPSIERERVGFGRRNAVISCALDSSILSLSASRVGLFISKRSFTCSQVHAWGGAALGDGVACVQAGPAAPTSTTKPQYRKNF